MQVMRPFLALLEVSGTAKSEMSGFVIDRIADFCPVLRTMSVRTGFLVVSLISFIVTGCGGGNSNGSEEQSNDAFNVRGSIRISSSETIESDGSITTSNYIYDSDGRLEVIELFVDGSLNNTLNYSYAEDGRLSTRLNDLVAEDRQDFLRESQYDGTRRVGVFSSILGEPIDQIRRYEYTLGNITGYRDLTLDPPIEDPVLTDGELVRVGSYEYNESGFLTRWEVNSVDADTRFDGSTVYSVDSDGRRISHQEFNLDSELLSTTTWVYENAPCIEFPTGSISQWVCLQ